MTPSINLPDINFNDNSKNQSSVETRGQVDVYGSNNSVVLNPTTSSPNSSKFKYLKIKYQDVVLFLLYVLFGYVYINQFDEINEKINNIEKRITLTEQHNIEGNRQIARIHIMHDLERFVTGERSTISRSDLVGLEGLYNYYVSINGNHDVPIWWFEFQRRIKTGQITVVDGITIK